MHIQKVFVIIAFNETLIEKALDLLAFVPIFGHKAQEPFRAFLNNQKARLHQTPGASAQEEKTNLLAKFFESFVVAMVVYFLFSILNSAAQAYHSRDHNRKSKSKSKKKSK